MMPMALTSRRRIASLLEGASIAILIPAVLLLLNPALATGMCSRPLAEQEVRLALAAVLTVASVASFTTATFASPAAGQKRGIALAAVLASSILAVVLFTIILYNTHYRAQSRGDCRPGDAEVILVALPVAPIVALLCVVALLRLTQIVPPLDRSGESNRSAIQGRDCPSDAGRASGSVGTAKESAAIRDIRTEFAAIMTIAAIWAALWSSFVASDPATRLAKCWPQFERAHLDLAVAVLLGVGAALFWTAGWFVARSRRAVVTMLISSTVTLLLFSVPMMGWLYWCIHPEPYASIDCAPEEPSGFGVAALALTPMGVLLIVIVLSGALGRRKILGRREAKAPPANPRR